MQKQQTKKKGERNAHEVAEHAEEKEGACAENPKTKRPRAHERLGKGETPARRGSCLGSDGGHTAHPIDDGVDLPVSADAQHDGGRVPPAVKRVVQCEEDEGADDRFGGSTRGDAEDEWVQ